MHTFRQFSPTDHFTTHAAYLPVYERLFKPWKDTEKSILEIGVAGGGGLQMYHDWFPKASLKGVDVNSLPPDLLGMDRISFFKQNAYQESSVELFKRVPFAVMIDDGPHNLESQEFFVAKYTPLLVSGGVAVVEDVRYIEDFERLAQRVPAGYDSMGIDLRYAGPADNLLFVVFKP
jgi:hypothetical protein